MIVILILTQVEQWIEGVFPTPQDPAVIAQQRQMQATGETLEEAAANRKEMMLLVGAVVVTLLGISLLMVSIPHSSPLTESALTKDWQIFGAWLMGARFDIAFQELWKTGFGPPVLGEVREEL
jgi:farnesyl-diphosphate farnesyltransferase